MKNPKKIYRSQTNKVLLGVCGGLGEYFNIDPVIFRIIFLFMVFGMGSGLLLYLILAVVIPENQEAKWVEKNEVLNYLTHKKDKEFYKSILDKL